MTVLRRLLRYFAPYRGRAIFALLAMAVVAISTGALLFFLRSFFDDVLAPPRGAGAPGSPLLHLGGARAEGAILARADSLYAVFKASLAAHGVPLWVAVPTLLFAALLVKNLFSYLSEYAFNSVGLSMVRDLRDEAYTRLLRQPAGFFSSAPTGDLMSRLLSDVELIQNAFGTRIADLFQGVLTIVVMLGYIVTLNARLTLISLVVAPLLLWPIIEISRRLRTFTFSSRERIGTIGEILEETIRGLRIVKTYGMEPYEEARFREANQRYYRVNLKTIRVQAISSPLMEVISGAGLSALFIYSAHRISSGSMTTGDLISFLSALLTMYAPIKNITKVNLSLQQAIASASRIFELIDREGEIVEAPGAVRLPPIRSEIRFDDVTFRYDRQKVLEGVSFAIPRGQTVAIVGPSGAGKTTLANLLPRLFDPSGGRITIDGVDIRHATLTSLRSQIALVTQETFLFSGSVRANVAYGLTEPKDEEVREAARAAHADEFIRALPAGYDTEVGENASRLSGGQRQRLAIARAFFRDAPILILDEATSQLDSESERVVADALDRLMQGKTTLVIAHRLSTVRRADRIIVLKEGRIVQSGRHEDLLAAGGLYRHLYELQYFDGKSAAGDAA